MSPHLPNRHSPPHLSCRKPTSNRLRQPKVATETPCVRGFVVCLYLNPYCSPNNRVYTWGTVAIIPSCMPRGHRKRSEQIITRKICRRMVRDMPDSRLHVCRSLGHTGQRMLIQGTSRCPDRPAEQGQSPCAGTRRLADNRRQEGADS